MNFVYAPELAQFIQILILGGILSVVVMYSVELFKNIITTDKTYIFSIICFVISFAFAVFWAKTFAEQTIGFNLSLWLGLFLWLGANGFFKFLEKSDSFLGKTVKSYSDYLAEKNIFASVDEVDQFKSEIAQLKEENNVLLQQNNVKDAQIELLKKQLEDCKAEEKIDDSGEKLSEHFKKSEFMCQCEGRYCDGYPDEISQNLIDILEAVREKYGKPIIITSGLRCERHNAEVGGVDGSRHIYGKAADFWFEGMDKNAVIAYMQTLPNYQYAYTNESNMKYAVHIGVY